MAIIGGRDTKPNLSSKFYEQYTGTTLYLSGNTVIETNGNFNNRSKNGYQISGSTFLNSGTDLHQIILGSGATVGGACSTSIGFDANAQCIGVVTMGARSESKGNFSVDIGFRTGSGTGTKGLSHVAIGHNTAYNSSIGSCAIAIGKSSIASQSDAVSIGAYSQTTNSQNVAIGRNATANGYHAVAIGPYATASSNGSMVFSVGVGGELLSLTTGGTSQIGNENIQLGVGISSPNARIDIVATGVTEGFRLRTNDEGANKVLTSDVNGYGNWVDINTIIPQSISDRVVKDITKTSHGFAVGEVVTWSGGTYLKAIADGTQDGEIIGVVSEITDTNNFKLTQSGWISGLTGLVTNSTYFVSDTTEGAVTSTEPTTQGHISRPIFIAISTTEAIVFPYRGNIIGVDVNYVEDTTFNSYTATTDSRISTNETNILNNDNDIAYLSGQTDLKISCADESSLSVASAVVATCANQLTTSRQIALGGDVTGSANFNGTSNITITATVQDDSHNHVISNIDNLSTCLTTLTNDITSNDNDITFLSGVTDDNTADILFLGANSGDTTPAGVNGNIQFNDNGAFGGASNLLYTGNSLVFGSNNVRARTTVQGFAHGSEAYAFGYCSHAEGNDTIASGSTSHAEGNSTCTIGGGSHSEGILTTACGNYSHAEGTATCSVGNRSHAEGRITKTFGYASHAEGDSTQACGIASHAEGVNTIAFGDYSHAEGNISCSVGNCSHAEGNITKACGIASHAEGCSTTARGNMSHAEGRASQACGAYSHAEGVNTIASGSTSHAEGRDTTTYAFASHAEGRNTQACGQHSHAEGNSSISCGLDSHAEGFRNCSVGQHSHAEGWCNIATGIASHAEGKFSESLGNYSHAEGLVTISVAPYSHAEGKCTESRGAYSHTGGVGGTFRPIIASGCSSFNHSFNNPSQTLDYGANADYSAILGGINNHIASGNTGAVIIGGNSIQITSSVYDYHTNVGALAIWNTPDTGSSDDVLVWDSTDKKVKKVAQSNLGSPAGSNTQIQFNNSGSFGADTTFFFNCTNNALTLGSRSGNVGNCSVAFGQLIVASGCSSMVLGVNSQSIGNNSFAMGGNNCSVGLSSFVQGTSSKAIGSNSSAMGSTTQAIGNSSHAEGSATCACGNYSHSQNRATVAIGEGSHAGGATFGSGIPSKIFACGLISFNHSANSPTQTNGYGANADYSAILGGVNHNITSGNTHAAIIGGYEINLTGNTYSGYTAVDSLAIWTQPITGSSSNNVLVWDSTDKKVKINTSAGGGGGGSPDGFDITGDGTTTGFTINHAKGTRDVIVQIYQSGSPYATVITNVERTDTNNILVTFDTAPASGTNYRVLVL